MSKHKIRIEAVKYEGSSDVYLRVPVACDSIYSPSLGLYGRDSDESSFGLNTGGHGHVFKSGTVLATTEIELDIELEEIAQPAYRLDVDVVEIADNPVTVTLL